MTQYVLDAGALIGVDRDDRRLMVALADARSRGTPFLTTSVALAQAWRSPRGQQARLARFLQSVLVLSVSAEMGRAAGSLVGLAGTSDVIDATVALIAETDDTIVTSDPDDLDHLASTLGRRVRILPC